MKTNIYILLGFIALAVFQAPIGVMAAWYGTHTEALDGWEYNHDGWYHRADGTTFCDEDTEFDGNISWVPDTIPTKSTSQSPTYDFPATPKAGTAVANTWDAPGGLGYYAHQSRVISGNTTSISCQYWDGTLPWLNPGSLTYTDGWIKTTNIPLTWGAGDWGGSQLKNFDIKVYRSTTPQTPVFSTTPSQTISTSNASLTYTFSALNGSAYRFEVCPRDNAGNIGSCVGSSQIVRVDTTPPNPANISDTSSLNLLATDSQNFALNFADSVGSPVMIWYRFESNTNPATTDPLVTTGYGYTYNYTRDISLVDNDRGANGGRQVQIYIDKVCDQAGNCVGNIGGPAIKTISHNIYANPNTTVSNTSSISGAGIADGIQNTFTQTLKDAYGNAIIPATGIGRTISMNLGGITNTMYLNQYNRSGGSSVFVNTTSTALQTSGTQNIGNRPSSDGDYPLPIFVYTPTANSYAAGDPISDPNAGFGFTQNLIVSDSLIGTPKTFSQTLSNPVFKPLYTSMISGDLRDGGFIEGAIQSGSISLTKNSSVTPIINPALQVEFSGANMTNFNFFGGSMSSPTTSIGTRAAMVNNPMPLGLSSIQLITKLIQKGGVTVANASGLQFSTHFSYTLGGKSIITNSDIIGKIGGYWGTPQTLGTQVGVHIIGAVSSKGVQALTAGQFDESTALFSGVNRSTVRNSLRESITVATRSMTPDTTTIILPDVDFSSTYGSIESSDGGKIKTIKKSGGFITLDNGGGDIKIKGRRTLVVKGADLFIKSNMYYADKDSIFGIVIQKDELGRGGNLYISPNVTNVVGNIIIDGSVMSSEDGTTSLGVTQINILRNQLLIYGSIVSENTIGGSRMNPAKCPSLLAIACTTTDIAQKYDLNYLRRYYLKADNVPNKGGLIIGGATCTSTSCVGFNPNLRSLFTLTTDPLAEYPVIIEYDARMIQSPPPGFTTSSY